MLRMIEKIHSFLTKVFYRYKIRRNPRINVAGVLAIRGNPIVDIRKGANLWLGGNVMLNSKNRGYHLNMSSPVKLMADKKGAIISIGENTRINGACIHAINKISIGDNCLIAANCQIIDSNGHESSFDNVKNRLNTSDNGKAIIIEDNVWLGANSFIMPGVTIGEGAIIGASSVVTKDIPPMCLAAGNPAKVIKKVTN